MSNGNGLGTVNWGQGCDLSGNCQNVADQNEGCLKVGAYCESQWRGSAHFVHNGYLVKDPDDWADRGLVAGDVIKFVRLGVLDGFSPTPAQLQDALHTEGAILVVVRDGEFVELS